MLEHGGRLRNAALQYGIAEAQWLDLSSGLAPWPFDVPVITPRAWARLPETDDGLEQAACDYYGAMHVLPVAGSQMAIQLLPRLRRAGMVGVLRSEERRVGKECVSTCSIGWGPYNEK